MSRQAAEERYRQKRHQAFRESERVLAGLPEFEGMDVRLCEIDLLLLQAVMVSGWQNHAQRAVQWDWLKLCLWFRRNHPSRFDLMILCQGQLCALALGKLSASKSYCSVAYVEGAPGQTHQLKGKVLAIVLSALQHYCGAVGAPEMRLEQPLPQLIGLYTRRYGFTLVTPPKQPHYCKREVKL
jgi:hypothetical protein